MGWNPLAPRRPKRLAAVQDDLAIAEEEFGGLFLLVANSELI